MKIKTLPCYLSNKFRCITVKLGLEKFLKLVAIMVVIAGRKILNLIKFVWMVFQR